MKSLIKSSVLLLSLSIAISSVFAQNDKSKAKADDKEKSGDLIIHKKGNSSEKMTIVIDGDKITVNGKPIDEYKSDDLDIISDDMNYKMSRDAFAFAGPGAIGDPMAMLGEDFVKEIHSNKAFLGVMTKKTDKGAQVTDVTDGSAAEKAGLKEGDIITKVNDDKIEDADDLYKAIGKYKPADKITIGILRDGRETSVNAALGENKQVQVYSWKRGAPDNMRLRTPMPPSGNWNWDGDFFNDKPRLGMQVQDTEDGKGVTVLDVEDDEVGDKAGLKEDDIITTFNGKNITSVDDIKTAMKNVKKGDNVSIGYKRDGKAMTTTVKFPKDLKTTDL